METLSPESHETIPRRVNSARVCMFPTDLIDIMKRNAQMFPMKPEPRLNIEGAEYDPKYDVKAVRAKQRKVTRRRRVRSNDNIDLGEPAEEDVADDSEPPTPVQDVTDDNVEENLGPPQNLPDSAVEEDDESDNNCRLWICGLSHYQMTVAIQCQGQRERGNKVVWRGSYK